jgi:ribonuclease HI
MAFALLQTNSSSPFVQFKANIERWCSSNRAELAAILMALLISPSNSTINIFTDCKSVIDHYSTLISHSVISPRLIFKGSTNNLLWSMIMDIVTINSLNVTFHKIKAHSGDYYNDFVDNLARTSHSYNNLSISFLPSHISTIRYFPLWNNIIIEPNLRHFITDISRDIGFEKFLQLRRNTNLVNLDVDWGTTFFILNNEEDATSTSFFASNRKSHKIKFLLEELPTVEHVKLRRPDLYNEWLCPSCKDEPESFAHIWVCKNHQSILETIIFNHKKELVRLVQHFVSSSFTTRDLSHDTLWSCDQVVNSFNFVHIIKGIVPLFLFTKINSFARNTKITKTILSIFYNNIYLDINKQIWKPRCERMMVDEFHANINRKSKRQKCPSSTVRPFTNSSRISYNFTYLGIEKSIEFGGDWLQYYSSNLSVRD